MGTKVALTPVGRAGTVRLMGELKPLREVTVTFAASVESTGMVKEVWLRLREKSVVGIFNVTVAVRVRLLVPVMVTV